MAAIALACGALCQLPTARSGEDSDELTVPQDVPLRVYSLYVDLYLAKAQHRLWALDADGERQINHVVLTRTRVRE